MRIHWFSKRTASKNAKEQLGVILVVFNQEVILGSVKESCIVSSEKVSWAAEANVWKKEVILIVLYSKTLLLLCGIV